MDEEVFTLRGAAAFMKFSERFTRGLIKAGKLLAFQCNIFPLLGFITKLEAENKALWNMQ